MPWIRSGLRSLFPSLTWQARPQVARVVAACSDDATIVDLGAGGRQVTATTITVDHAPLPGTRLIADIESLPIAPGSVDLIIATGLLEHVADLDAVSAEMVRILKPGGRVHVEIPFLQQYHDDPIDCRRFTQPGLVRHLESLGLTVEQDGVHIGPSVTLITLTAYYFSLWFQGSSLLSKVVSNGVFLLVSILLFPLKYLDAFLIKRPGAHRLAFGVYATARKAVDP
ncbi:MAG: methyltransferase domain-containing protein [Magnetococcales bacterium]|nr:methyltransferase domain-containing protein [Magnetococcales bacterium]